MALSIPSSGDRADRARRRAPRHAPHLPDRPGRPPRAAGCRPDRASGTITPSQALAEIGRLGNVGIDHVIIGMPADPATFELLATEVVPLSAALPATDR